MNIYDSFAPVFWDAYDDIKISGHSEYWFKGGRGSGKSSFISLAIIRGIITEPLANALIYRKVASTLKDSVYTQIGWAIEELGLQRYFKAYKVPLEFVYLPTGQRIMFRGADDPMKSKSIKLERGYFKYLWFEELSEFNGMDAVRTIKQSAFRGVSRGITLYSYNPPRSQQNWVNGEAIRPARDRLIHHSSYLDMPPDWLKEQFILDAEALKETNERAYRNEYLGEVTGTGGNVFDNLTLRQITNEEIDNVHRHYFGLDFGFTIDPAALIACGYNREKRKLYIYNERYGIRMSNSLLADYIKAVSGGAVVRCDAEDPRTIAELKTLGATNVTAAKKGRDSVRHGITWLSDLGEIIIDPQRAPNAAREFKSYEYSKDRYGNFISEFPDADNHTIDAVRYAMTPESTISRAVTLDKTQFAGVI